MSQFNNRIEFANALRGLACLGVVWTHLSGASWFLRSGQIIAAGTNLAPIPDDVALSTLASSVNSVLHHPFYPGMFAVALFFLISGFVIPFSFDTLNRKQFAITRFFRIWPTYAAGFLLSIGLLGAVLWLQGRSLPYPGSLIAIHTFVGFRDLLQRPYIDGVLWTLEIEVRFYLVAMILGPILWRRASALVYLAPLSIVVICLMAAALFALRPSAFFNHIFKFCGYGAYVVYIFVGVALHFYYRGRQSLLFTAAVIAALLLASGYLSLLFHPTLFPIIWKNYSFALLVFTICMALRNAVAWDIKPLTFFAAISYPLYVTHNLIGCALIDLLMVNFGFSANASLIAALVSVVLVGYVLHVTLEEPTRKFGRQIAQYGIDLPALWDPVIGRLGRVRASAVNNQTMAQQHSADQRRARAAIMPYAPEHGLRSDS